MSCICKVYLMYLCACCLVNSSPRALPPRPAPRPFRSKWEVGTFMADSRSFSEAVQSDYIAIFHLVHQQVNDNLLHHHHNNIETNKDDAGRLQQVGRSRAQRRQRHRSPPQRRQAIVHSSQTKPDPPTANRPKVSNHDVEIRACGE